MDYNKHDRRAAVAALTREYQQIMQTAHQFCTDLAMDGLLYKATLNSMNAYLSMLLNKIGDLNEHL